MEKYLKWNCGIKKGKRIMREWEKCSKKIMIVLLCDNMYKVEISMKMWYKNG
jgi:hypothetical protein